MSEQIGGNPGLETSPETVDNTDFDNYDPFEISDSGSDFEPESELDGNEGQEVSTEADEGSDEPSEQPAPKSKENVKYAGTFTSTEALEDGYINLMDQMGKELDSFTSVAELEEAYIKARADFTRQKQGLEPKTSQPPTEQKSEISSTDAANAEVEQLKTALQTQSMQLQQMFGYLNALNAQAQAQTQQTGQQGQSQETDPAALLDEFYANPQVALEKMMQPILANALQSAVPEYEKEITQRIQGQFAPLMQDIEQQRTLRNWDSAATSLINEIPDFDSMREEIGEEIKKDPNLIALAEHHPDKERFALKVAYDRAKAIKIQKDGLNAISQQQKQRSVLQKQAGKMGAGRRRVLVQEKSPEEIEIDMIFADNKKTKNIFG